MWGACFSFLWCTIRKCYTIRFNSIQFNELCPEDDEDEVDDDVEEGLAEDHEKNERHNEQAAREGRTELWPAQLAAEHKWVP